MTIMKNSRKKLLLMIVMSFTSLAIFAQKEIRGNVTDVNGEPIIGASVIPSSGGGAVTDLDGNFTVTAKTGDVLKITYVGFIAQQVKVGNSSEYKIVLKEDNQSLSEVVVVGYGVQKKSDVTGALVRVGEKELNQRPVNNAFEALQGKAAGVDITSSQRPGTIGTVRIRGNRSLNASNSPLYVVDGVPLSSGGIETLNPRDIESVDILKDASSTAIYGSRGANGVVLITTKRGKQGKMQLSYSGSFTFEHIVDKSPAMSASDYITWRRWAYYNASPTTYTRGDEPVYSQDQSFFAGDEYALNNINKGWSEDHTTWDGTKVTDTDWTDFVTQTGVTQEHSISASGGTEKMQNFASFGYLKNDGTQKGQTYERYTLSLASDIQATKWFKMGGSINASYAKQDYGFSRTGQSSSSGPTDIYSAAKSILRYCVPYDDNGDIITMPGGSTTNTYTVIDEWKKSNDNRETYRALGSFYAQVDFGKIWEPLKGLMFKSSFGPDFRYYRNGIFLDANSAVRLGSTNYASRSDQRNFSWTWDNMILYNRTFGEHSLGVTLLQSASKSNTESSNMSEQNVYMSSFKWNNMGAIDITNSDNKASMGTGLSEYSLASYMARVNYSYKDRYLLTVSGRFDGSSVLAEGNKWDFFPSLAVGWRMEQEKFLRDVKWIEQLKLRFGVGTTGNSAVDPYGTLGVISSYFMPFSTGNTRILVTNEPYYTSGSNKMPNKNLSWEKTTQYNIGVDFSFLKGRIGGTVDFYHSTTNDLLMNMTIPSLTGYPSILANIGKTKNSGVDITLNLIPVQVAGFQWESNINAAYQKDEIVELANGKEDDISNAWFIGESINVYYGYDNDGLWQESDAEEMAKFNANGADFSAGNVKPVDQNGDYVIDADDRVILGHQDPRWTLGWTNTFTWKGFELSLELYGRFDYMVSTGGEGQLGMYQQREIDYWTPDNTDAEWQKPIYNQAGGDPYSSLLGFKSASFIKVRNLSLGYYFDKKICDKLNINSLKLYIQGKNLGNLYSSIDFLDLDLGTTYYNRGFTVGLQVDF
jgi:TonB-linked SusC/RagA family outer membrane protein